MFVNETWKEISGWPGYQVSDAGNIRGFKDYHGNIYENPHPIKPRINKDGYYELTLYASAGKRATKRLHRLVAETFLGQHPGLVINHIDGDKLNNNVKNLEWVTAEKNSTLASELGLYKTRPIRIIETGECFNSIKDCASAIKVHPSDINHSMSGRENVAKGLHFEYLTERPVVQKKQPFLYDHQLEAVKKMKNGCILNGGVGSGKSRTGLFYYYKEQGGWIDENGRTPMKNPKDLYIITTAKKRDSCEWLEEMSHFLLSTNPEVAYYKDMTVVVDSWNNIKKYSNIYGAFFIFDEDRVTGSGAWVKAFLKIAKKNDWIILSATPGDTFSDYIPVFVANGFYKNKTEFIQDHVIYSRYTKYPKIDKYIGTGKLLRLRNQILVEMDFKRHTIPHHEDVYCTYDTQKYKDAMRTRWDPFENKPIQQASGLCYVLRKIVNIDESRQVALLEIFENHPRLIIFYSFDYELDILRNLFYGKKVEIAEWNGHYHQEIPKTKSWVYLVNYAAGSEGFNCTKTDTIVFYSQNYSYKTMVQAAGRIDRLNTPYRDLYYYHLKSRSGIDLAISRALSEKRKFNETKFIKW